MSDGAVGKYQFDDELKGWDKVDATPTRAHESGSPVDLHGQEKISDHQDPDPDPARSPLDSFQLPKTFDNYASHAATLGTVSNSSLLNMPLEGKRACATPKLHLLVLLTYTQDQNWGQTCAAEIGDILKDDNVAEILSCSCAACQDGRRRSARILGSRETSFWVSKMQHSKRLFATCIFADLLYLIYAFLERDFKDNQFDGYIDPAELRDDAGLSLENAKSLLHAKDAFFDGGRISIFTYIRSKKLRGDRPSTEESNWLIEGLLTLLDKLALDPGASTRKIPDAATIKDLMIRDSPAKLLDREGQSIEGLGEKPVCMQSMGHLVLDLICFIAGGGGYVQSLDRSRSSEVNWLKDIDWAILNVIESLPKAFQLVRIMICPDEDFSLSKDENGNENFKHVARQFRRIWPDIANDDSLNHSEKDVDSDTTSLSSQGLDNPGNNSYEEIAPGAFRSMLVRYHKEGHRQKRCDLTILKSTENNSLRLDLLSFDHDAIKPSSCHASPKDLRFVPLYAYGHRNGRNEFSAKFQLAPGSSINLPIPYTFRFRSTEEVQLFQAGVTGRIIEKDIDVNQLSLKLRKRRTLRSDVCENCQFEVGRLQLWRVLEEKELKQAHEDSQMGAHGFKQYALRAEMALFSEDGVIIIGIRAALKLKNLPNSGLRIESKQPARNASLAGRRLRTMETTYPGLPLFQLQSFDGHQEGEKVVCDTIEMRFSSKQARDEFSQYLESRYNRLHRPMSS